MTDIIQAKEPVPQGYHYTNAGVLPNDWTSRSLSSIVEEITETVGTRIIETVSISAGIGFVNQAKKFGKELSGKQYDKYIVLHKGDFSYNKGNSNVYPQGCVYRLNNRTEAAVPNVFESFRVSIGNPDYYEQLFISGFLNRQLYSKINHGVRDDGLLNLRGKDFYSCEVPCPPLAEQERIAGILTQCDKVIELKQKKIDDLAVFKKECLRRLFPANGCTKPEVRFPGFTDDWEERKFGKMFKRRTERNNGQFDNTHWISVAKMYIQEPDKVTSNNIDTRTYVMRKGDIAFEGHSNSEYKYGRFVANDIGDGIISELFPIYMHIDDYDEAYWKYAIQIEEIMAPKLLKCIEISYTSSNKLDDDFFLKEAILVPALAEQAKIGQYFRHLDHLIALHQQELNEYKTYKNTLAKLLLTGIVRVSI